MAYSPFRYNRIIISGGRFCFLKALFQKQKGMIKMIDEKRFGKTGTKETSQNIIMENRKKLSVSGVLDVESFDEDSVFLYTEAGMLNIKGEELHINKLSVESGDVTVEGQISALIYTEEDGKTRGSLLSKIFK